MADWLDPPWAIDPSPWQSDRWILTKNDYLDRWRAWFCELDEQAKWEYQATHIPPSASAQFYNVFGKPAYDPAKVAEQHRDRLGQFLPPWLAYPHIGLGSIGWRMGVGEDYWIEFTQWYKRLQPRQKLAFREQYPEPAEVEQGLPWTGFYDRLEK